MNTQWTPFFLAPLPTTDVTATASASLGDPGTPGRRYSHPTATTATVPAVTSVPASMGDPGSRTRRYA